MAKPARQGMNWFARRHFIHSGRITLPEGKIHRSYSRDNLDAAHALLSPREEVSPFVSGEMSEPEDKLGEISHGGTHSFF